MDRLKLIQGGGQKKAHHKQHKNDVELWVCRLDKTSESIEVCLPYFKGNRTNKGDKRLICLRCFVDGRITEVQ
ncbi:MAG: hypothetical protein COB36_10695 [Alphaproteobacteria bacterium]|nr:MAG: hypothetical protein COB36_10695 [Alphaproteobacteria bacterium]